MKVKLEGNWLSKQVWCDGQLLEPGPSQKIYNHSPDGFNWGYGGSGPAQLALAILLNYADENTARAAYQQFKWDVIAALPQADFSVEVDFTPYINTDASKNEV